MRITHIEIAGIHAINVSVDPLNRVTESFESDNNATLEVHVMYESLLEIWDSNDPKGGSRVIPRKNKTMFYANYTNASGHPINVSLDALAHCNFSVSVLGSWESRPMAYNITSQMYEFNRTFTDNGTYAWNVSCSAFNYDRQSANNSVHIGNSTELRAAEAGLTWMPSPTYVGNRTTINVTIYNDGTLWVTDVNISVYINESYLNSTKMNISEVSSNKTSFFWYATKGDSLIKVSADPQDKIFEVDKTNNNATRLITVTYPTMLEIWDDDDTEYANALGVRGIYQQANFYANYSASGTPANSSKSWGGWWNESFAYRVQVNFTQPAGYGRTREWEHVRFNVSFAEGRENSASGAALVCNGSRVAMEGYALETSGAWATKAMYLAQMNFTAAENKQCHLYYDPVSDASPRGLDSQGRGWNTIAQYYDVTACTASESKVTTPCAAGYLNYSRIWWADVPTMCSRDDDFILNAFCYFKAPETNAETFGTRSDDSSYMYIDGSMVVDHGDGCQSTVSATGTSTTAAGRFYGVKVYYNENTGSDVLYAWFNNSAYDNANADDFGDYCHRFIGDEWEISVGVGGEYKIRACEIQINMSGTWVREAMAFNKTSKLYEYNMTFTRPGIYAWNATCAMLDYENLSMSDTIKIVKVVNVRGEKRVSHTTNAYLVGINVRNEWIHSTGPVVVYEFVPSNFTASSFTLAPSYSREVTGQYSGSVYVFDVGMLNVSENKTFYYNLTYSGLHYNALTQMLGLDPIIEVSENGDHQGGSATPDVPIQTRSQHSPYPTPIHIQQERDGEFSVPIQTNGAQNHPSQPTTIACALGGR